MYRLAPSILSADFSKLGEQVSIVEKSGADMLHMDIMDGHFVPNISYGADVMKSLVGKTDMLFDVHLMIENADKYIPDFVTANTEYITVHSEACIHLNRTIQQIKGLGVKAGVALNPATPLAALEWVLEDIDMVLLMSVNPGFGGQSFIKNVLTKIQELKEIRDENELAFDIEVDGGIGLANIETVKEAGANIFVAGSSIFKADDIAQTTKDMLALIK